MSKGILRNLRVKRVAIVDMGANFDKKTGDGAHVMLWKSVQKDGPSVGDVHVDSIGEDERDEYEKGILSADQRNSMPDSDFAAVWTDASGKKHRKLPYKDPGHLAAARGRIDQADIPADVKAAARRKIESATNKEKPVKKSWKSLMKDFFGASAEADPTARAEKLSAVAKAAADMPDDGDADDEKDKKTKKNEDCDDPMMKSMSALQKRVEESEARAVAAETIAKGLVEKAERDSVTTILKSFRAVSIDLTKDVEKFYEMKKTSPAVFERTIEIMKSTDEQLAASALFKMHGSNGGDGLGGDAWGQLDAKAAAIVAKGDTKLTKEQALDMVMTDPANKDLIKRYREQQQ